MADRHGTPPDFADIAVAHWERERPDLDFTAMGTLARFARLHIAGSRRVEQVFAAYGLDRGEFDVLASLRRTGAPHEMPPSQLAEILLITRAGMTKRVDRLEARGLVSRRADPEDRRSLRIGLTPEGSPSSTPPSPSTPPTRTVSSGCSPRTRRAPSTRPCASCWPPSKGTLRCRRSRSSRSGQGEPRGRGREITAGRKGGKVESSVRVSVRRRPNVRRSRQCAPRLPTGPSHFRRYMCPA
ncbi:MarR family transcriptional regulator [Streptomyces cavourensis]